MEEWMDERMKGWMENGGMAGGLLAAGEEADTN